MRIDTPVFFFILALSLISVRTYSQARGERDVSYPKRIISKIEVSIGPSLKLGRGPDYLKDIRVPKFGFAGRLGLIHELGSRTELSLNISYIQKGLKFRVYSEDLSTTPPKSIKVVNDNTLNYLEIAFIPRYDVFKMDRLYVGGGPYVAYLINSRFRQEYFENGKLKYTVGSIINSNANYKNLDFGASLIIGSNFSINEKIKLIIEFNYSVGLVEINKPGIDTVKNNSFSLQIGISVKELKIR